MGMDEALNQEDYYVVKGIARMKDGFSQAYDHFIAFQPSATNPPLAPTDRRRSGDQDPVLLESLSGKGRL